MIILLLLLTLCGCSTKTRTEYLTIPERYLECDRLEYKAISGKAQEDAGQGNYKLFAIEILEVSKEAYDQAMRGDHKNLVLESVDVRLSKEAQQEVCVNNASDARAYQERMTNE